MPASSIKTDTETTGRELLSLPLHPLRETTSGWEFGVVSIVSLSYVTTGETKRLRPFEVLQSIRDLEEQEFSLPETGIHSLRLHIQTSREVRESLARRDRLVSISRRL